MITEVARVSINGKTQDDLTPDIIEIEVQEDVAAADVFRVRLALAAQPDGTWSYVDDARFTPWNRLSIQAGYMDDTDTVMDGYITHADLSFAGDDQDSYLEISGMDASAQMDLEEKQLAWPNKKDSEIAQAVFLSHGLSHEIEDTLVRHQEAVSTTLQTETDIRFLRRLAARNGFECYIKGGKGYFRSPNMQDPPQTVLAIQFGAETNLTDLKVKVDATPATAVEIRRVDPVEKQENKETLAETPRRKLGKTTLAGLRSTMPDGHLLVKRHVSASTQEMKSRLRNAYEAASQFITVEGGIDSRAYGRVLRAKRLVTIKGIGANFSGLYYVTRVRHLFTADGYTQHFEGYRNGIGLTGAENFAAALPLAIPTGIGAASVPAGNRVLPAQQQASTIPGAL